MNVAVRWDSTQNPRIVMSFVAAVTAPTATLGYRIDPSPVTKKTILADVARRRRVSVEDLVGPGRWRDVAHPRQEAMYLMRQVKRDDGTPRYSMPEIGRILGGRDHSTVYFGIRAHAKRNGLPE